MIKRPIVPGVDMGLENSPPEVARRDALKATLLKGGNLKPKPRATAPILSAEDFVELDSPPEAVESPPVPSTPTAPIIGVSTRSRNRYNITLRNADFVIRFTSSMFSVSDHAVGIMMNKHTFTFEPKLSAEYEVSCKPSDEVYRVLYAGGYLDMGDSSGDVLLAFIRVATE